MNRSDFLGNTRDYNGKDKWSVEAVQMRYREYCAALHVEYAKLLRTIGVGEHWPRLERDIPRDNPYAMRFYKSLRAAERLPA